MGKESESILAEIPVVATLALGNERLTLFVTGARIIVAHVGKRGTGAMATATLLGRLGGGLENVLKSGGESRRKGALQHSTPRSEEHTSELQSRENLVCRLLLEKTKSARTPGLGASYGRS